VGRSTDTKDAVERGEHACIHNVQSPSVFPSLHRTRHLKITTDRHAPAPSPFHVRRRFRRQAPGCPRCSPPPSPPSPPP
jgi:hypothetical protein